MIILHHKTHTCKFNSTHSHILPPHSHRTLPPPPSPSSQAEQDSRERELEEMVHEQQLLSQQREEQLEEEIQRLRSEVTKVIRLQ